VEGRFRFRIAATPIDQGHVIGAQGVIDHGSKPVLDYLERANYPLGRGWWPHDKPRWLRV